MFNYPLANISERIQAQLKYRLLLLTIGVALLTAAAQISLPWQPVPLTFQSATVILLGFAFGARLGGQIVFTYLLLGIFGIPVFADFAAGPQVLLGATSGYLIGFLPAVIATGYLAQRGFARNWLLSFVAALVGASIIFACGIAMLYSITGWDQAIAFGLKPFLITEPVKLLFAAIMAPYFWRQRRHD